MTRRAITIALALMSPAALAAPFDTCPSKAYLFQANPVQVYGVNLVTGANTLLQSDTGLDANINGVGFNFEDRYIYGYDTTNKQIVRLGQDFQAEVLNVSGVPTDHTFYVGDVYDHTYYLYRQNKGLFKIDLSPLDSDPNATLQMERITDSASVRLTDFAFHPGNGGLYGIDNQNGNLYLFDTTDGSTSLVGNAGITGTFGAGYFDVNGYFYVSRNSDGEIFRIDLSDYGADGDVTADEFAPGPNSNQNDGARCANAPVIDEDSTIDFGDAPDSYKTLLATNGPRHQTGTAFYLGSVAPDSEGDGLLSPLDDNKAGLADEDGVGFVTALEAGQSAIVSVQASTQGYLSAWIDWNADGDFEDSGEKVISDSLLSAGSNALALSVPVDAAIGSTYSRFRFAEQSGLDYFGGATSGEVEDHPVTVIKSGTTLVHYPSEQGYATIAYEDNWPKEGDYDMNDVVMRFRMTETLDEDNHATRILITGYLAAYGAGYHNGFAIRLPGLNQSDIDSAATTLKHNGVAQENNGLETDSTEAIFIIDEDLKTKIPSSECNFYRTAQYCQEALSFEFEIDIYTNEGANTYGLGDMPYDPFIFSTPGSYVRDGIWYNPGRGLEIHLPDQAPTEQFDTFLYGWQDDDSVPAENRYYKTSTHLPWVLLITDEWKWPREHIDLIQAYPLFAGYTESEGVSNTTWHAEENAAENKIYEPEE
ncbi:LruC domain-containing protein [Grimontia kaedaensis]|uniref:LruC domain-containing protein n=1 Tax=Grimontia kaedaensis TaxID=2872157 RepID=A0ABY4WZK3_9GAMM|nr:LruC domain-containing protein [Grimontia kaedaensis]USH04434.1 LruC domain-containing protein [Grimontia kaedaensis]